MKDHQAAEPYQPDEDDKEINVRDYLLVIKKRIVIVLAIVAVVFSLKMINTLSKVPVYNAYAEVLIERSRGAGSLDMQNMGYDPFFLATQAKIVKSENVARRVVENLNLDTRYRNYFIKDTPVKPSFLSNIKRQIILAVRAVLPAPAKQQTPEDAGSPTNQGFAQVLPPTDADIITRMVQGGLMVMPEEETKIVSIIYRDRNPAIAQLVANATVQAYKEVTLEIKMSSSSYSLQWMTKKAEEERKKLEDAEIALQKYMRENDLVTVEDRLAVIPQKLSQISSEFTTAQTERKQLEEVYRQIMDGSGDMAILENIPLFATNPVLQAIREKTYKARQNIKDLSKKYGAKHPVMIKANDELEIINNEKKYEINRIVASTKNSYELAKSREENLRQLLGGTKTELLNVNEKFIQYSIMKREVDTNRVLYDALTSNIKRESVTEQAQSVNIWVVKTAEMPWAPSSPNTRRDLALGLVLGLFLGVGCAFVLEYLDNTVKSEKDLSSRFGLTVLGTIEEVKSKGRGADFSFESFILKQPLSPPVENYRLIRSNLLLSSADHPPRTIMVTSMGPQDGKTATTLNIARVLSQVNKRVLIIDCDLRKPRMHTIFGVDNKVGLSNYLSGNHEGNILLDVPGENLKFISSGQIPPNPAELLNSKKMANLLKKMSEIFDFVLLDSPPIERVTDSLAISQIVDGTIVVVRAGKTTYDMLSSGLKKFKDINTPLLGFVLNGMDQTKMGSGYYSGYRSYYAKDTDKG